MPTAPRKTTASSRKPRTAARAASRPPVARRDAEPEELDELEADEAEAQEFEAVNKYVTVTLRGIDDLEEEVRIIPPGAWRQSWQRLLNNGQVEAFAQLVLHEDDFEVFVDLDPTNEQVGEMVGDAATRAGESLGKSRGPAPSSRRTRRR